VTLVLTVLEISAPVLFLAGIGFVWVRWGFAYDTAFVTRLSMTVAVPALIFTALSGTVLDPQAVGRVVVASLLAHAAMAVCVLAVCQAMPLDLRTWLSPLTFGNTGNVGLPLCLLAFGETGLALAVVVFAVAAILQFTFGLWVVAGGGSPLRALREPLVGATLLGALFLWRGWHVPAAIDEALSLAGQMAIPLMLITLGVAVGRLAFAGSGRVAALSAAKVVAGAGIAWPVARLTGLDPVATGVLILQMAVPVAVTSYLLAEKYGADAQAVAGLVVVSTLMSVAALPVLLAMLI